METAASAYERAIGDDESSAIDNEDVGSSLNAGYHLFHSRCKYYVFLELFIHINVYRLNTTLITVFFR